MHGPICEQARLTRFGRFARSISTQLQTARSNGHVFKLPPEMTHIINYLCSALVREQGRLQACTRCWVFVLCTRAWTRPVAGLHSMLRFAGMPSCCERGRMDLASWLLLRCIERRLSKLLRVLLFVLWLLILLSFVLLSLLILLIILLLFVY